MRGGLLGFDIRRYPALLIREPSGGLGALLFNHERRLPPSPARNWKLPSRASPAPAFPLKSLSSYWSAAAWSSTGALMWRNALRARDLRAQEEDLLGSFYRQVFFDVSTGVVEMFREAASAAQGNPGKASLSLNDSTQVFRESDAVRGWWPMPRVSSARRSLFRRSRS